MGLDMYLNKKYYVGANYEHNNVKGELSITKNSEKLNIELNKVCYIVTEFFYWRKANAIHNWFVKNIQNGIDDCGEYYIDPEKLLILKDLCQKVIDNNSLAEELLPNCSGFFFGSTDYDVYYFDNIKDTLEMLNKLFNESEEESSQYDIYYRSSW